MHPLGVEPDRRAAQAGLRRRTMKYVIFHPDIPIFDPLRLSDVKGDYTMKKVLLLIATLLAGMLAGLILPAAWRGKLSQLLATRIEWCLGHMPDG